MNVNVILYVKRLATAVAVDAWGEEWKDCVVWISDGNNSFPVKQGVLMHEQVDLLGRCTPAVAQQNWRERVQIFLVSHSWCLSEWFQLDCYYRGESLPGFSDNPFASWSVAVLASLTSIYPSYSHLKGENFSWEQCRQKNQLLGIFLISD